MYEMDTNTNALPDRLPTGLCVILCAVAFGQMVHVVCGLAECRQKPRCWPLTGWHKATASLTGWNRGTVFITDWHCIRQACGVSAEDTLLAADRLAQSYGVFERPLGVAGIWGAIIRAWLDELLPDDALDRCRSRVHLVVTKVMWFHVKTLL